MRPSLRAAIAAAATTVVLLPQFASADTSSPDGDTDLASNGPNLTYGGGNGRDCDTRGTAVTGEIEVSYNGNANDHFAAGEPIDVTTTTPAGVTVTADAVNVPNLWDADHDKFTVILHTTVTTASAGGKVELTVRGRTSNETAGAGGGGGKPNFQVNVDCSAPDPAGDTTPPTISLDTGSPNGLNNWYTTSPVTVTYSASDNVGVTGVSCTDNGGTPFAVSGGSFTVSGEGTHDLSCVASDAAGNESTPATGQVKIDLNNPALNITGDANGTSYDVCAGATPTRPTFSPSDTALGSGVDPDPAVTFDRWTPNLQPSGVGSYVYSAQAQDFAGRQTSETRNYSVAYGGAYSGILQPINADGSSRFKLGSTVPVKFKLTCNGAPISNAVATLRVSQGDTTPDPGVDEVASTSAATTGNLFRYDATAGQYIFNLATKPGFKNPNGTAVTFTPGTWTLSINLDDGTFRNVKIQLFK